MRTGLMTAAALLLAWPGLALEAPMASPDPEEPLAVAAPQAPAPEEPAILRVDAQGPALFDGPVGGAFSSVLHPTYKLAERLADGMYGAIRRYVVPNVMPGQLGRGLSSAPDRDSYDDFQKELRKKQSRFAQRLRESYPDQLGQGGYDPGKMRDWQGWAVEEQQSVLISALGDSLIDRYGFDGFGDYSERYARDRRHWDGGFLTMAALVGGSLAYLNGIHVDVPAGSLRVIADLRAGYRIREVMASGAVDTHMATVELGYKNNPLRVASDWGVENGHFANETIGLKYRLRY